MNNSNNNASGSNSHFIIAANADHDNTDDHANNKKKRKHMAAVKQLQKDNKKLNADFGLMREKLRLDNQTTHIRQQLMKKEIDQFKDEADKKNRLIYSLFLKLFRPDMMTITSPSTRELLTNLLPPGSCAEIDLRPLDNVSPVEARAVNVNDVIQQEQLSQQLQRQLVEICKSMFDERDKELNVLKAQVDDLKRREIDRSRPNHSSDHEDELTLSTLTLGRSREVYQGDEPELHKDDDEDSCIMGEDELEHHFLADDTYSYFAVADYFTKEQGHFYRPTTAFSLAVFALLVQIITLSIFIMDVVDINNPRNPISVPPGVGIQVRLSQLIALLISCWNQDEIRASFNVLALGYNEEKVRAINYSATNYKWYFSIFIRMSLGWFSLVVTFILIVNSDTVRDVMLDFAAVTFVSELDNGAFLLSNWGYMGKNCQKLTMRIKSLPVWEKKTLEGPSRRLKLPRLLSLFFIIGSVIGFWAWVTIRQEHGHYVHKAIFVQFGDDFSPAMGAFSGIYELELDNTIDGMRLNYVEIGEKSDGRFSYCSQDATWIFQYGDEPEDYDEWLFAECWHKAVSLETKAHDIIKTSDITWFVSDDELKLELPLQHFFVIGQNHFYGKECESGDKCGKRMHCDMDTQKCVCDEGLFGLNCEFREPCQTLAIDSRDKNGFFGTRSWSRRYSSLPKDIDGGGNNPIQVYGKPVYVGDESVEGSFDVMIFTGRRWILTDSSSIEDYINFETALMSMSLYTDGSNNTISAKRDLAEFLADNFHAYWSNYTFYFASEPVDAGTPTWSATPVGLRWFRLETTGTQGASLHSGEEIWKGKMSIEANLICTVCDNETNPCFYGATCTEDGTCDCTTGSSGSICQIPPDNNGLCNVFFNTPEFGYDGGDCCQETCRNSVDYTCGKGMIEEEGVSAYGFIGYPNCQDPRFKSKLSGSTTLYEIVERGSLRCGSGIYPGFLEIADDGVISGFEADLCKSIAAAVLDDPEAIEIVETTWADRWRDLTDSKFDVLIFRTTHTAERDIYQGDASLGFSFAPIPTFYDGLRYGGIPPYSGCADNLDFESPECIGLRICVTTSATWLQVTESLFPDTMILGVESEQAEVDGLEAGICNVIAGEISLVAEFSVRERGFTGPVYELGNNVYSKEPLSAVTRQDDRVWSKFVAWIFEALVQAEESGITQSTAKDNIAQTNIFGDQFQNIFQNAVAANGNFGEIYRRNLQDKIPRTGLNTINTGGSGLIYSFPFGSIETRGQDPIVGGAIETIRRRGVLNCGIKKSPGFADIDPETGIWRGFEVDMCRGIAAALFSGSPNVNFIPLASAERFSALTEGTIDVMTCGTTHTLTRELNEPSTGEGFDFTPTIFHDGLGFAGRSPYVECAEIRRFDTMQECASTRICVPDGTTWLEALLGPLNVPAVNIFVTTSQEEVYQRYVSGDCNVIAGESTQIAHSTVREFGLEKEEEYIVGSYKYTKEPLAIVSKSDDAQFSDFLRWIVFGFFHAEEAKITRGDSFMMPANNYLFGSALSGMWQHSVEAVGNYGEIFTRNFEGILERGGSNNLNDRNGPQFYSTPGVVIT